MDRQQELQRFKKLDLQLYAESRGFVVDRRLSSRSSVVMRRSSGDKIGIAKTTANTFVYYNYKTDEGGSIIDFVIALDGGNLGTARRTLRGYSGSNSMPRTTSPAFPFELQPSKHDASRVLATWMKAKSIPSTGHPYLTKHRGIPAEVQNDPIFRDRIRICERGNAMFPHFNQSGLCGIELKNGNESGTTFTGFSPGGMKGLACSRPRDTDVEMVLCETAVDLYSLAAIEGTQNRRFFSTAGQFSSHQAECLRSAVNNMPEGAKRILLAFDNDDAGRQMASRIRDLLSECRLEIVDHFPRGDGNDWNDELLSQSPQRPTAPQANLL
ncbi:DUF3991 and TOPRIM domain-containing protein [Stieleria tagensis]|uniref:DUF3991 and TOPRIM domain-containing protein n=1 Tax=Stieleria tagensis TaxID=2956795 RepID=UPI00209B8DCD|nr:DUF3991 and TOPRIM domain-containing protein [Stieleria tagensis]